MAGESAQQSAWLTQHGWGGGGSTGREELFQGPASFLCQGPRLKVSQVSKSEPNSDPVDVGNTTEARCQISPRYRGLTRTREREHH